MNRDDGSSTYAHQLPPALPQRPPPLARLAQHLKARAIALRDFLSAHCFLPSWLPPRWRVVWVPYLLSPIFLALLIGLSWLLLSLVPGYPFPSLIEILGLVLIGLNFGLGPSILATLLGAFLVNFLLLPPSFSPPLGPGSLLGLLLYLLVGYAISLITYQVERARKDAEAAKHKTEEFVSIVSHELRTPITILKTGVQLLERKLRLLAESERDARHQKELSTTLKLALTSSRAIDRLNGLIEDLVDSSRIEIGKLRLRPNVFNITDLIQESIADQRESWPGREIVFQAAEEYLVEADSDRVRQVFTNFLTNALKYATPSLPIQIHIRQGPEKVRVEVEDQGPGLTPEQQSHLWERFYRVEEIEPQQGNRLGLGLGLYISRSIIGQLGGDIGVRSAPGQGSTFWFSLPRR